ncbi:unnamed protein product [Cylicocyclus nassatus]|uniref:THAP4-like heme-binding domain-containing protein n=1 Tax=Cylicocyclus nassatus TaxID=53992 RepID=A0AA36GEH1_CYLNA|nr:unnamed protein product [Cylicocyclus nassatus]
MPWDLRPVQNFIGLWGLEYKQGRWVDLPPPDQIDFAINPLPKFGARAVNITHTYYQNFEVKRHDYGYMPVKNATRRDPRIHVAYLTTSSEGWSMMEQGQVKGPTMFFHLKQFLRRSFDVGRQSNGIEVREFERHFEMSDYNRLIMKKFLKQMKKFPSRRPSLIPDCGEHRSTFAYITTELSRALYQRQSYHQRTASLLLHMVTIHNTVCVRCSSAVLSLQLLSFDRLGNARIANRSGFSLV